MKKRIKTWVSFTFFCPYLFLPFFSLMWDFSTASGSQASWERRSSWGKIHGEEFPGSLVGQKFCEPQPNQFSCSLRNL